MLILYKDMKNIWKNNNNNLELYIYQKKKEIKEVNKEKLILNSKLLLSWY